MHTHPPRPQPCLACTPYDMALLRSIGIKPPQSSQAPPSDSLRWLGFAMLGTGFLLVALMISNALPLFGF